MAVVAIRNRLVHRDPRGATGPAASEIIEPIKKALEELLEQRGPTELVVSWLARVKEERRDALGRTRCTLEDESGITIESTSLGAFPGCFVRHFFVFQRTNPVAVDPTLVLT